MEKKRSKTNFKGENVHIYADKVEEILGYLNSEKSFFENPHAQLRVANSYSYLKELCDMLIHRIQRRGKNLTCELTDIHRNMLLLKDQLTVKRPDRSFTPRQRKESKFLGEKQSAKKSKFFQGKKGKNIIILKKMLSDPPQESSLSARRRNSSNKMVLIDLFKNKDKDDKKSKKKKTTTTLITLCKCESEKSEHSLNGSFEFRENSRYSKQSSRSSSCSKSGVNENIVDKFKFKINLVNCLESKY